MFPANATGTRIVFQKRMVAVSIRFAEVAGRGARRPCLALPCLAFAADGYRDRFEGVAAVAGELNHGRRQDVG